MVGSSARLSDIVAHDDRPRVPKLVAVSIGLDGCSHVPDGGQVAAHPRLKYLLHAFKLRVVDLGRFGDKSDVPFDHEG